MNVHYALNLEPVTHDISKRTLERYLNLFEKDELAKTIMSQITVGLVDILEIKIDEQTEEVIYCPAGHKPVSSMHEKQTGKTKTIMPTSTCRQGEFRNECPVEKCRDGYRLHHTAKQRRLAGRRREENTDVFPERYRVRGGIEGTNSGLKRRTGLGRLRVRGSPRVFHSILLKAEIGK